MDADFLKQLYLKADPCYSARFTVPVLWDTYYSTIVNNESSDIIKMFNSEFNQLCENPVLDLMPTNLKNVIEDANEWIYEELNNGVYKAGFATSQEECKYR